MTLIAHLYCLKKETFSGYTEDAIHFYFSRDTNFTAIQVW